MHSPAEIAQHAAEHQPTEGSQRWIGLTTAFLSILIAVCSSQANSIRTDLLSRMVEEDGVTIRNQTISTKYLMLQSQLQHIYTLMPDAQLFQETETALHKLEAGSMNAETRQMVQAMRLHTKKILNSVMPSPTDVTQFAMRIRNYRKELDASQQWVESYRPVIAELNLTNTRMEQAQLLSELAVILASLALMLSNVKRLSRILWIISIGLGVISIGILTISMMLNQSAVHRGEKQIAEAKAAYQTLIQGYDNAERDEALLKAIEADLEKLKIDK